MTRSEYPVHFKYINCLKDSEIILQKLENIKNYSKEQGFDVDIKYFFPGSKDVLFDLEALYSFDKGE